MRPKDERAFISTYQKLGILTPNELAVLKPVREHSIYSYNPTTGDQWITSGDDALLRDGIAYYQAASYVFRHGLQGEIQEP